jgi:hypothetical protein
MQRPAAAARSWGPTGGGRSVGQRPHPGYRGGAGLGWMWSGVQLGPLAAGFPPRWPVASDTGRRPRPPTGTGTGAGSGSSSALPPVFLSPFSFSVPAAAGGRGLRPRVFSAHRPLPYSSSKDSVHVCPMPRHGLQLQQLTARPLAFGKAFSDRQRQRLPFTSTWSFSQSGWVLLCRFRRALQSSVNQGRGSPFRHNGCTLCYPVDMWPRSTTRGFCGDLRGAPWPHSVHACSNGRPQRPSPTSCPLAQPAAL